MAVSSLLPRGPVRRQSRLAYGARRERGPSSEARGAAYSYESCWTISMNVW